MASCSSGSTRRRSASPPATTTRAGSVSASGSAWAGPGSSRPETAVDAADDALVAAGHGISDLRKEPSARDTASDAELTAGVGPLWQKIALWRPGAVVFIYRRAATISAGREIPERWGQLAGVAMGGRPCFLMPGPYAPAEEVDEGLNLLRNLAAALAD